MSRARLLARLAPAVALLLAADPAAALWSGEAGATRLDLGGSLRTVASTAHVHGDPEVFGLEDDDAWASRTGLRLTLSAERPGLGALEAHLVTGLVWQQSPAALVSLGSLGGDAGSARYRVGDAAWNWLDDGDWEGTTRFDRLNARFATGAADVTVGRQAINFSQAYFWNPLDVFLPFDPAAFDRDYKPGVDALRVDVALGLFSGVTLVAAAGREREVRVEGGAVRLRTRDFSEEQWYGSALIARARTNWRDWDLTIQGGKVYGGTQVGIGFSGEIGPLGVRGEAAWFGPSSKRRVTLDDGRELLLLEEHLSAVIGVDHRFESSLYVSAEYLWNGGGGEDLFAGALRAAVGETLSLGEHLAGLRLSYEFHPLLTGAAVWIHSFSDSSDLVSPTLVYSLGENADLVCGASLGRGARARAGDGGVGSLDLGSEFGAAPDLYFVELKLYF